MLLEGEKYIGNEKTEVSVDEGRVLKLSKIQKQKLCSILLQDLGLKNNSSVKNTILQGSKIDSSWREFFDIFEQYYFFKIFKKNSEIRRFFNTVSQNKCILTGKTNAVDLQYIIPKEIFEENGYGKETYNSLLNLALFDSSVENKSDLLSLDLMKPISEESKYFFSKIEERNNEILLGNSKDKGKKRTSTNQNILLGHEIDSSWMNLFESFRHFYYPKVVKQKSPIRRIFNKVSLAYGFCTKDVNLHKRYLISPSILQEFGYDKKVFHSLGNITLGQLPESFTFDFKKPIPGNMEGLFSKVLERNRKINDKWGEYLKESTSKSQVKNIENDDFHSSWKEIFDGFEAFYYSGIFSSDSIIRKSFDIVCNSYGKDIHYIMPHSIIRALGYDQKIFASLGNISFEGEKSAKNWSYEPFDVTKRIPSNTKYMFSQLRIRNQLIQEKFQESLEVEKGKRYKLLTGQDINLKKEDLHESWVEIIDRFKDCYFPEIFKEGSYIKECFIKHSNERCFYSEEKEGVVLNFDHVIPKVILINLGYGKSVYNSTLNLVLSEREINRVKSAYFPDLKLEVPKNIEEIFTLIESRNKKMFLGYTKVKKFSDKHLFQNVYKKSFNIYHFVEGRGEGREFFQGVKTYKVCNRNAFIEEAKKLHGLKNIYDLELTLRELLGEEEPVMYLIEILQSLKLLPPLKKRTKITKEKICKKQGLNNKEEFFKQSIYNETLSEKQKKEVLLDFFHGKKESGKLLPKTITKNRVTRKGINELLEKFKNGSDTQIIENKLKRMIGYEGSVKFIIKGLQDLNLLPKENIVTRKQNRFIKL